MSEERLSYVPVIPAVTDGRIARSVGEDFLRTHRIIPLALGDVCTVAMADPEDSAAVALMQLATRRPVKILVSTWPEIESAIDLVFRPTEARATIDRCVGQLLLQFGLVNSEQLDEAMRLRAADGKSLDEFL